jgi:hypothetical protein
MSDQDNQIDVEIDLDAELLESTFEEPQEVEEVAEVETVESEEETAEETTEETQEQDDVTAEDEIPQGKHSKVVISQREHIRKLEKQLKLEKMEKEREKAQREALSAMTQQVETLPPEPDIEDPDINYDTDLFKKKYQAWTEKKVKIEQQQAQIKAAQDAENAKINEKLQKYYESKPQYKGINEAEQIVVSTLEVAKQNAIVKYAKNPALVISVLGKNPVLLNKLANLGDIVEYGIEINEIERKANEMLTNKKTPPPPEKVVTGKTAVTSNHEKHLDKLRAEGKITEAVAYRKKHGLL